MTPEEEAAVLEGLAEADRGAFVSAEAIAALGKRFGALFSPSPVGEGVMRDA
jgi:hypothetical protein